MYVNGVNSNMRPHQSFPRYPHSDHRWQYKHCYQNLCHSALVSFPRICHQLLPRTFPDQAKIWNKQTSITHDLIIPVKRILTLPIISLTSHSVLAILILRCSWVKWEGIGEDSYVQNMSDAVRKTSGEWRRYKRWQRSSCLLQRVRVTYLRE